VSDRWEVNWVRKDGHIPRPVSNVDRQLYSMATTEIGRETLDFIVELVHEIEQLQTENIDMRNTLHYVDHATWGWENVGYYGPYND